MEDECRKAQEDEKLVILSIYEKEARFEVNAWKIWKPLSVTITLTPSDSASKSGAQTVSIDLRVVCSAGYPQIAPNISLTNPKGISNELVQILQNKLKEHCKSLLGSAMILELCSEVRNFLYENTGTVKGSFHDNMVKNLEEKQHEKQRQRLNSEIRDVEQVEKIVKERELVHLEAGKQEEVKPKPFLEDAPIRVIAGKTITVKSSNFPKRKKPSTFCTEWIGVYENEEILVSEWFFKYSLGRHAKKAEQNFDDFLRKLEEIESNFKVLPTLTGLDQTVVPYLFCTIERRSLLSSNLNVTITIGQRIKEAEQSLPSIINSIKHEPSICRRLAGHAVCALRWMHEMQLVHGAVTSNSFWVMDNSFRVSDAGTLGSLLLLTDIFQKCINGEVVIATGEEKFTRKRDLFALGTMIDTIRHDQASSNSMVANDSDLTTFIKTCQSAKSVEELLNMPYLKVDLDAGGSGNSRFGTWHIDDNSRVMNDFIVMKRLGSGGFGDVLLARNKVDDGNYAIKRIPLYAKSEKLNRRITREAKLFAKLNHPNVVRYYSAWIENAEKKENETAKKKEPIPRANKEKSMGLTEDSLLPTRLRNLENGNSLRIGGDTTEWSSSYREMKYSDSSSSEEESKEIETLFDRGDSDDEDFICFEGSAQGFSQETEESNVPSPHSKSRMKNGTSDVQETPLTMTTTDMTPTRLLYIQMEFCGHGTLRSLIDNEGLVGKANKVWRMFREILSGLSYIHKQNMIHRDIKPMNILLDEEDRIKIGDFGLATRDFFRKMDSTSAPLEVNSTVSGLTKDIGTELYMAPELFDTNDPAPYSSKIDVYSTGVVLFEMFYRPLPHGMERLSTLKALKKNISFPQDFGQEYITNQQSLAKKFITMMLQEKAENRPTVDELLEDERIAVDGDDQAFQGLLQKVSKRGSQAHRSLLEKMFRDEIPGNLNYCFDISSCQEKISNRHLHLEEIKEQMRKILASHCYQPMYTHQLLASTSVQAVVEPRQKPVFLLDSEGFPVALPLDLRQNFVRYCCRNDVHRKKRYCIDRVFRSSDGIGFEHPTERWEASVDAIGPISTAITLTAEMLATAVEICSHSLPNVTFTLKIGHFDLVIAVCRHFTLTDDQTKLILQKLHELSTSNKVFTQSEKVEALTAIVGSKNISHSLLSFFPIEDSFTSFKDSCKTLTKSRDEFIRNLASKALAEIQKVTEILEAIEVPAKQVRIKFDASLVYRPATFHDGLLFMVAIETTTKTGLYRAIVLGGGRYDSSLVRERHPKDSQPKVPLCLVGCSIALDVLVSLRKFYKERCSPTCSAVVCSLSEEFTTEKFMLARRLWSIDVPCDIMHEAVLQLTDFLAHCQAIDINHVLVVFGKDTVLVYSNGQANPFGKVSFDAAVEQCCLTEEDLESPTAISNPSQQASLLKSQSTSQVFSHTSATASNCNIKFAMPELANFAAKKRLTNSVFNALPPIASLLSSKLRIEVVVTELSKDLVKNISGSVSRATSVDELASIFDSLARQFGKAKEGLELLFEILRQLLSPKKESIPVIIIYRNQDGFYKVIL